MKAKIFRILGAAGFVVAMSSLSACFSGPYFPAHPGYAYGSPAYAYPEYYPQYVPRYVPMPRYFAYNPQPYWRYRQRWEHEEHEEHEWHRHDYGRDWYQHDHDHD
jgi:hypothetical protein